jgi:hypothetical protein
MCIILKKLITHKRQITNQRSQMKSQTPKPKTENEKQETGDGN